MNAKIVITISAFTALILLFFIACSALDLPRPDIQPRLENASVKPELGNWTDTFTYRVNCTFSKEVNITLEVYDLSLLDWRTVEDVTSTNIEKGKWKITWESVKICSDECAGTSRYRFKYNGSVLKDVNEKEIHDGPKISPTFAPIEFKSANVEPPKGNFSTSFNYTVEVINRSIEIKNVSLKVYNGSWISIDKGKQDGNKWEWKGIRLGKYEGNAKYKFSCNNEYNSTIYYGPLLLNITTYEEHYYHGGGGGGGSYSPWITYEKATVNPNWVLIGVRENKTFNYSVVVDKDVTLKLEIYNLSSNEWEEVKDGDKKSRPKGKWGKWKHEWTVNLTLDKNWKGICKYQFYPKDRGKRYGSQIYYDPEIKSIEEMYVGWKKDIELSDKPLKEPIIRCIVTPSEDRWCKPFKYTATVKHPDRANMTLALFVYKPGSDKYKLVPYKPYKENVVIKNQAGYPFYNENSITVVEWTAEGIFDENDANKPPYKYYIWYYDGWNEAEIHSEKMKNMLEEPKNVLSNHEPSIKGITSPEDGSVRSTYIYKAEIEDPDKNDTIFVLLHVKDPLNRTRYLKPETIERKNEIWDCSFVVSPESGIFSRKEAVDAINKTENKSFRSRFRFVFQDECMKKAGRINNTMDWIKPPNVSLVKVGLYSPPKVDLPEGKYTDKFKYTAWFTSSEDIILNVTLLIYDPSRSKIVYSNSTGVAIDAETINFASWVVTPGVFGPDYFGKNVNYTIKWDGPFGISDEEDSKGPYIFRAIPIPNLILFLILLACIIPFIWLYTRPGLSTLRLLQVLQEWKGKFRKGSEEDEHQ